MNKQKTIETATKDNNNAARQRFCDSFGFYGILCLGFFASFVAMFEYGGKF